jgi:hypothetical protein
MARGVLGLDERLKVLLQARRRAPVVVTSGQQRGLAVHQKIAAGRLNIAAPSNDPLNRLLSRTRR